MFRTVFAALSMWSCFPPCVGESGLDYSRADGNCADWQKADALAVAGIKRYTNEYFPKFADGYWLSTKDSESWYSPEHGYRIAGFTSCPWKTVVVGSAAPTKGALAHELLHALNSCEYISGEADPYHVGWVDRGYESVLTCFRNGDCQ